MTEIARPTIRVRRFTCAAAVLIVGGLVAFGACAPGEFDEQPPIIVKGGSLLFESAEPWVAQQPDTWLRDMPNGLVPTIFELTFEPGTCAAHKAPSFRVFYDPDDEGPAAEESFEVTLLPRPGGRGRNTPAVKGARLLNDSSNTLRRDGASKRIIRIEGPGAQVLCTSPTKVTATPRK